MSATARKLQIHRPERESENDPRAVLRREAAALDVFQPSPLSPVSDLMTVAQAAEYLNVSQFWLYDHAGKSARRDPKVPCVKLGSVIRFRRSSLDRMIAQLEDQSEK
jgi:hypothetical protein